MKLRLNGEERVLIPVRNMRELVQQLGLPEQITLAEHNGQALRRDEWDAALLAEGDQVELLRIAAGG